MRRALITGASGFLGNAVSERAVDCESWEVYGLLSGRRQVKLPDGVVPVAVDLRDFAATSKLVNTIKPDILIHLAWSLSDRGFLNSYENTTCLEMSLNLLRAFVENGGKRFVFSGSSAEYGYESKLCKESDACNPVDLYGRCKLSFTETARLFCEIAGIEYVTARFFSIYGAGEKNVLHAVPLSIDTMSRGEEFICRSPENAWDYVYIDDAAEATVRIMKSHFTGVVNVGTGVGVTMRSVFQAVAKELGTPQLLRFNVQDAEPKRSVANTEILRREIGYVCNTGLSEGVKRTVLWSKRFNRR